MPKPPLTGIGMTSARTRDRLVRACASRASRTRRARAHPQRAAAPVRRRGAGEPCLRGHGAADRPRPDDLATLRRGAHDRGAARGRARRARCWRSAPAAATRRPCSRRWWRPSTASSASPSCSSARGAAARPGHPQRVQAPRRRLRGLAAVGALRRHPGGSRGARGAGGAARAARRRRTAGHAGRARRASSSWCASRAAASTFEREVLGPATFVPLLQGLV